MNQLIVILFIILMCIIMGFSALITLLRRYLKKIVEVSSINKTENETIILDLEKSLDIKKCIDDLIDYEISNELKSYISLNTKYDIIKLDVDAKKIANNIYKSFKEEFFKEPYLVFNTEFYYNYIVTNYQKIVLL